MKKQVNKSNSYSSRRFFSFPKNGTIPASMVVNTPTRTEAYVCWSPVLKKYFFADANSPNKVYSQSPDGQKILVHTSASRNFGIHWSKTLQKLVLMCASHIYTSDDGIVWDSRTVPASYAPDYPVPSFVDASSYLLVFNTESSTGYMYKTTDGITWVRSASGTGSSTNVVAGAIGDTVGYSNNVGGGNDLIRYTSNGTSYATATGGQPTTARQFFPPTAIRNNFIYIYNDQSWYSADGISYVSVASCQNTPGNGYSSWFGGLLREGYSTSQILEWLSISSSSPSFVGKVSGYGTYPTEQFVSIEGEYATYTNRTKAHRVGTWLDIGDHEVWLIGGGAPNANTSVGGTAGCMVIHRLTVTEKWRYCVYVYLGAAAIVDVQTGEFVAYASMLTSTSTSAQVNTAGFGSEVYYGLGSGGGWGAACGPSNGGPAFMAITNSNSAQGCLTTSTTTATTPPDFWTLWDMAGNPSGTGYPGTSGDSASTIGFCAAANQSQTLTGSFGSGGSAGSAAALSSVGGNPLAIIYSR